jgi:hypothetical protein
MQLIHEKGPVLEVHGSVAESRRFDPIFVHSSARSGSTYLFNVFRQNKTLMCFNEAIIDGKKDYEKFKTSSRQGASSYRREGDSSWDINHDFLDKPDYQEFIDAWDAIMHLCPKFPEFQNYLPNNGQLGDELQRYLAALIEHAQSQSKRPVLCETNSRGRAGALRARFGGFHIAHYRDPFSQFGSWLRALIEGGSWGFLAKPAKELGVNRNHPLYSIVPERRRPPELPWRSETRARRWESDARYIALVARGKPENIQNAFCWHLYSWVLTNLAAISYSDLALDIDRAYDQAAYRESLQDKIFHSTGISIEFDRIQKFERYYCFDFFDMTQSCEEVSQSVVDALHDGRLERAIRSLGQCSPITPVQTGVDLLFDKITNSLQNMASSRSRTVFKRADWELLSKKRRLMRFHPLARTLLKGVYPMTHSLVQTFRRAGWVR